ncbi:MAG: TlpA family protein disulfide reductase, partial [Acidimicrobiales bacterium]
MSEAGEPVAVPPLARRRRALWISAAVAAVVGLLVAALATRPPAESVAVRSPLVGRPAPAIAASTIDGQPFRLANLRGRWVVLNYFATWCVPCRMEHADLVRFQAKHEAGRDASVVAVVYNDSSQAVKEFRAAEG